MASSDRVPPYAARRCRLAARLRAVDAALVTRLVNVRYLTGLDSSNAAVLVAADGTVALATDSRYALMAEQVLAEQDAADVELIVDRAVARALAARAADRGVRRLAFEAHEVTVEQHDALAAAVPALELVPLGRAVEELRIVKDETEIAALRRACAISDQAFADVLALLRPGVTEREIARALETRMVELGADRPAFDSIVASGPNGAIPHHHPGDRAIAAGDLVTMDFGALYHGYHADMTRTVAVGEPARWQRDLYELVAAAQRAGREALRPGARVPEVDKAARILIEDAGHGKHFPHGLGHGVGLEIHEAPMLGYDKAGTLGDGVPLTIEPGVYLPGRGGVRIEDTLVVRTDGPELLTETTKELLVV